MCAQRVSTVTTVGLVMLALAGCAPGPGTSTTNVGSSSSGGTGVSGNGPTSSSPTISSSMSSASVFVGADPSIPQFSGAPADQSIIDAAMSAAGVSLTPPAAVKTVYVAPPTSYTSTGASQIGSGTQADPYRNLIAAVNNATAGEHIYLEPGTYEMYSMAQAFGESADELNPTNSGTQSDPIVVTTDPATLNWATGTVAILDFQNEISIPSSGRYGAIFPKSWWTFENLDVEHALDRIFWLGNGQYDLIYHNDLHNVTISGTQDNIGIVSVMRLSGGDYNDFIIGNNIHGLAQYDANGNVTSYSMPAPVSDDVNIGCTYSEDDQYYNSNTYLSSFPTNGNSLTIAQLATYTAPPDNNVYFYENAVHGCMRGIANKEPAIGPWYVLSNIIYNVQEGIKMPLSGTPANPLLIRNNIIYNSGAQQLQTGIKLGGAMTNRFLGDADNVTVANNTVIDASSAATLHNGGFNDVVDNNLFVTTGSGVAHRILPGGYVDGGVNTAGQNWFNNGTWPNAIGEYLFPVNASNPYFSAMPDFLQETGWSAMSFSGNLYTSAPTVVLNATPLVGPNLSGTDIDQNATVLSWTKLSLLFRNAATDDFRAGSSPGILATVGSQIP